MKAAFKFFDFGPIKITKADLKRLPKHKRWFLIASSLAANDLAICMRMVIAATSIPNSDQQSIQDIILINKLVFIRLYSSKIFEFLKMMDDYFKRDERANKQACPYPSMKRHERLKALRTGPQYEFATKLRNEVTNHYVVDSFEEAIDKFDDKHTFRIVVSEIVGNSYYPIGEEVGHTALYEGISENENPIAKFLDWMQLCNNELQKLHQAVLSEMITSYAQDKQSYISRVIVKNEYVTLAETPMPVLIFRP